jgi:sugar lactone lactonase YvrE
MTVARRIPVFAAVVLAGMLARAACAQSGGAGYTITTIAGNGPVSGIASLNAAISGVVGIAVDSGGNVYFVVPQQNRVFKTARDGTLTTVAGTGLAGFSGDNGPAILAQLNNPIGIAIDSSGNLYISDTSNDRVRKVSGGVITTVAGDGIWGFSGDNGLAINASLSYPTGVAIDNSGNLYIADSSNYRVRKVSNAIITTVAGNGTCCYSGDNGSATNAQLNYPYGLAIDYAGSLYIADYENWRIRKVTGGVIVTVAGNGINGFSGDNGPAVSAQINYAAGIAIDGLGNLYIADSGNNLIRKVTGGTITTIAGGGGGCTQQVGPVGDGCPATQARLSGPDGVALDSSENLYIADSGDSRIREVAAGVISTIAGNGSNRYSGDNGLAIAAQLSPRGVAVQSRGNFYVSDTNDFRIRNISGGLITTAVGNGTCCYNGENIGATGAQEDAVGIALDTQGNLYTAEFWRIREVSNGTINTIAGNGSSGYSGDNGPAISAQISSAEGVALDGFGNVYIADQANNRVRKVSGGVITTVAGGGPPDGVSATAISLGQAVAVAIDSAGNVYFPSPNNHRVFKVSTSGAISTVAGNGSAGFSGDNGPPTAAQLNYPYGVAVNAAGTIVYIADRSNSRVRMVTGGVITTVAGGGSGCAQQTDPVGDGCSGVNASLNNPGVVALDSTGTVLYIADSLNYRVRKLSGGIITTVAGNGLCCYNGDNIAATSAELSYATGVTLDNNGNLIIGDSENFRVRKVSGGIITTIAGTGAYGYSGDNGPATSAQVTYSYGVAADNAGNIYIADAANHRIRKVAGGVITTVVGTGTPAYSGDNGPASSAAINDPYDVAMDTFGNLYIADTNNYRIRKVSGGTITTIAGNGWVSFSGDGGSATLSQISSPSGVAVDGSGNLYILDSGNSRIRQVSTTGLITTVAGNGNCCYSGDNGPATSAAINSAAIAADNAGNLYLANQNAVRKVSGGAITTIAGTNFNGYSGDGGPATGALLNNVQGLGVDSFGNVYVADNGNAVIRLLTTTPETITSLSPPSVIAGTGGFTLQVDGAGFSSGDTVLWNGTPLTTTFVNSGQLTALVSAVQVSQPETTAVTVNGISNAVVFPIVPDGTVTVSAVSVAQGGSFSIPVALTLNGSRTVNNITFGVQIVPVGSAPALTGSLSFTSGLSSAPVVATAGTTNSVAVLWNGLSSAVSGTTILGFITGTLPGNSTGGTAYSIQLTGAGGSLGNTSYNISVGPPAILAVQYNYLVGDSYPFTSDAAPNFGDGVLNLQDLVQELFAANSVPGFRPGVCSDRFDAMDTYPADTETTRGGDGVLDINDVVLELFRVNNLNLSRPVRDSRGGTCSVQLAMSTPASESVVRRRSGAEGALVLGVPQAISATEELVPVFLEARRNLSDVALTFALGDQRSQLRFVPGPAAKPSLTADGQIGVLALAWTDGLNLAAGAQLLLGYVAEPAGVSANLTVYGLSATQLDDHRTVVLNAPGNPGAGTAR